MTLQNQLLEFNGSYGDLKDGFAKLAKHFLFGGYFQVGEKKIYLKDIEFYYHDEIDGSDRIKDEKMYHRNRDNKTIDYFIPGTFHNHVSGLDFCFENETLQFRASILLRAVQTNDQDGLEARPTYVPSLFLMDNSLFNSGFNIKWVDVEIPNNAELPDPIERHNLPDGKLWRYKL